MWQQFKILCCALVLSMALPACKTDITQLIVIVSSDYGDELHSVGIDVSDENGNLITSNDFLLKGESKNSLPFSFTIEPGVEFLDSTVFIVALALDKEGKILTERSVRVGFVSQSRRLLRLELLEICRPKVCMSAAESCINGNCLDNFVAVRSLPEVAPGQEFIADASPSVMNDAGPRADVNASGHDAGRPLNLNDAAIGDANIPGPSASCLSTGCPGNQLCVNPSGHSLCQPNQDSTNRCECRLSCDPFGAVLRCGLSTDICTYLEDSSPEGQGYCTRNLGGGEQNAICSAFFNSKGERTGDDCNRTENYLCSGVSAESPDDGRCTKVCRTDLFLNCQFLLSETTYECATDERNPTSILGGCKLPAQSHNDISSSCFTNSNCQSDACLRATITGNGICTAGCGGLSTCPADSTCMAVTVSSQEKRLCFRECDSDIECINKNRTNVCHSIGVRGICYPRCELANDRCPGSQGRCNPMTGHCE